MELLLAMQMRRVQRDPFIVGPKTPKYTMGNAKTDNAIVLFAAIGAKDNPILIPAEG